MNIGISSPIDIKMFTDYFLNETDKKKALDLPNLNASSVNSLVLSFLETGNNIRLFTLSKTNGLITGSNIEIHLVQSYSKYPWVFLWGDFINAYRLKKCIAKNLSNLDVLHAHWTYSYAFAASYFVDKLPVFCSVRDWASYIWKIESLKNKITWSFRYLMNELVFKSKKIKFIANSQYTADLIFKKYGISTPIIPNPISSDFLLSTDKKESTKLSILCISSSNDKRKNIITLLQAFQKVQLKYSKSTLTLVGSAFVDTNPSISYWKTQGLLSNVILAGHVQHNALKNYFDISNLFVTPSLEETFGNTLLESFARKVPVIGGTNSGAIPNVLEKGKLGFLCDVSDPDALAQEILRVHENPQVSLKKAINAFDKIKEKYIGTSIVKMHIDLYQTE